MILACKTTTIPEELVEYIGIPHDAFTVKSGTTGECDWTLDENGTLLIDGNGRMDDYDNDYKGPPWMYQLKYIKSLVIHNGVTYIGESSVQYCDKLDTITIDSKNPIYDSRNNCNAIIKTDTNELIFGCKNTLIPDSVTSIKDFSFYSCVDLLGINIPKNITSINRFAFGSCTGLSCVNIPENVNTIDKNAFIGCNNLKCILVSGKDTNIAQMAFGFKNNNHKIDNVVIYGVNGSNAEQYAVNNGFTFIALFDPENIKVGDVNCDNEIDILDATQIQKNAVNKLKLNNNEKYSGDVNGDNETDIIDATQIQRYTINKINSFSKN